jgi:hypothetical protein
MLPLLSIKSASLFSRHLRVCGSVCFHDVKAAAADRTAKSTSEAWAADTEARNFADAGFSTSTLSLLVACENSLLMNKPVGTMHKSRVSESQHRDGKIVSSKNAAYL